MENIGKKSKISAQILIDSIILLHQIVTNPQVYVFLHLSLLREYLILDILHCAGERTSEEVQNSPLVASIDKERMLDDFLLIATLAGNDFLPHLHLADISQGGMESLIRLYGSYLHSLNLSDERDSNGPWLLGQSGKINWGQFRDFLSFCSALEDEQLGEKLADIKFLVGKMKPSECNGHESIYASDIEDLESAGDEAEIPGPLDWEAAGGVLVTLDDYKCYHYWRKIGVDPKKKDERMRIARSFLQGIQWVSIISDNYH